MADAAMDSESPLGGDDGTTALQHSTSDGDAHIANPFSSPLREVEGADPAIRVDVETLDQEEFAFLDGAARLAELQAEFNDVRLNLARTRNKGHYVPLKLFRAQKGSSLNVTDIHSSLWCEVQVEYKHMHRHLKSTPAWTQLEKQGKPVQLTTPAMKQGATMHLAKELEVHDIVHVPSVTREDKWSVDLVNTYLQLATIKAGGLEREITVFGDPFGSGFLINGIIDQAQYSVESGELLISDYKTRRSRSLPQHSQSQGYSLQLMLYKSLLDGLTQGRTKIQLLNHSQNLSLSQQLTDGPLEHIAKCGLQSVLIKTGGDEVTTFGAVAESVLRLIAGLQLPLVGGMTVHYEWQEDGEAIGTQTVEYNEEWMGAKVRASLEFWTGTREAEGVSDIEDVWKCRMCQFHDVCSWRWQKTLERSPAARGQSS